MQYALDRRALAAADPAGGLPATRLLAPAVNGYDATPLYPLRSDVRSARQLAAEKRRTATIYTWVDPPYTDAVNSELRRQLAAIGIQIRFVPMGQSLGFEPAKAERAD